jgi:hypothetical protein
LTGEHDILARPDAPPVAASGPGALHGVRVVDQTQVMAGPFCSMLLADMGAEVIKVEPPGGEHMRGGELELAPGVSASFLAVNRNKRGMTLDLKQPEGVEILKKLVATAGGSESATRPCGRSTRASCTARSRGSARPVPTPTVAATTWSPRA